MRYENGNIFHLNIYSFNFKLYLSHGELTFKKIMRVLTKLTDTLVKAKIVIPETPTVKQAQELRASLVKEILEDIYRTQNMDEEDKKKFTEGYNNTNGLGKMIAVAQDSSCPQAVKALQSIVNKIDVALKTREDSYNKTDSSVWSNMTATKEKHNSEDRKLFDSCKEAIKESKDDLVSMPNILMRLYIYVTQGAEALQKVKDESKFNSVVEEQETKLSGPR